MDLESQEDLSNVVLDAPIGICILNASSLKGEIVNNSFLEVAGKTSEAIIGKYYWDAFSEVRQYYEDALNAVISDGVPYHANEVELMLVRHGREEMVFVTFVYSPLKNKEGKVTKVAVWVLENTHQVIARKKIQAAEELARESEQTLRNMILQAPVAMCMLKGPSHIIEVANDMIIELWGKRKEDVLNKPVFQALPEAISQGLEEIMNTVYHTGETFRANEHRVDLVRNGILEVRYLNFVYDVCRGSNNSIIGVIAVATDVTEQVLDRRKTENDEARLRLVMNTISLGTWDFNPANGELTWSEECKAIYGLPPGVAINFDLFADHIHPGDKEFALQAIQQSMDPTGDGSYDIVYRIIRYDDRSERWIRAQGKVFFNSNLEVERFIGTVLDIHEARQAEEKSANLAAIVESTDDAIITKSLDGIITSWNQSAQRMFGYTPEEIIGRSILTLIPRERHNEEPVIIARLKNGDHVNHFETQRITKNKQLLDISLTISPVRDRAGNIIGISKIARDIRHKKEEEQRKNDFIAMVSHELKTPLTSVRSYVQVLLGMAKNNEQSFQINALTRTEVQVKKMSTMIEDFLSLARLEEGKISLNKEVFELFPVIRQVITDARLLTAAHQIQLTGYDSKVYADKDKIEQVLTNLLTNAIKYAPDGGNITINCERDGDHAKISVSDEGIGINPDDQKKLFNRFYRVENEQVKTVAGFGVGLYLVAEILRYHESTIAVESKEGQGSVFCFVLETRD